MGKSKIETYIGFAIRARKIIYGSGAICALNGGVYLIICDGRAAKNTRRMAGKFKRKFRCPVLCCKEGFENAVNRCGSKIVAISDKSLAEAIVSAQEQNYFIADESWLNPEEL